MSRKQVTGWHFASSTLRDGSPLPAKGVTLKHDGDVVPCKSGYHLSVDPLDALQWAPGLMVAKVRARGTCIPHGNPVNKWACSQRLTLTEYADASGVVAEFARLCALRAARVYAADALGAAGLTNEARSLRALADDAAADTIETAAWDAARAAWDAAGAAWDAAGAAWAARAAAGDAARAAAGDAAAAAWAECRWQSQTLRRMLTELVMGKAQGEAGKEDDRD